MPFEVSKGIILRTEMNGLRTSTMDEETEEGGPPSKTTLSGEHGRHSRAKSPEQQERADSPGPSCVSMKSDWSMNEPFNFNDGSQSVEKSVILITQNYNIMWDCCGTSVAFGSTHLSESDSVTAELQCSLQVSEDTRLP
ncbi:hypothetical protein N1851_032343 [Merluccius polli]|uniref:Uncharacterized protein n=1 Tax=Merluccius polli TaxID=89951 RepID=A0AA47M316_MERPO|nr:hypothetical protein N1851_032343 [Merluccius polli]